MKSGLLYILFPILILGILFGVKTGGVAYAEDLGAAVDETLDGLDLSAFEEWLNELSGSESPTIGKSIRDMVESILAGENEFDFPYFLNILSQSLLGEAKNVLPYLTIIIVVCLLFGFMKNLTSGFKKVDVQRIVYVVCYGVVLTVIARLVVKSVEEANKVFSALDTVSTGCFPVLVTLVAAMGGTGSASVFQPMVLVFGSVLLKIVNIVVMPLFFAAFIFGLVGNLSEHFPLDKLSKGIRSGANWVLAVSFGLFSTLLAAEGITGASVDGLAIRGAKYALASYVPVVGTYLKEGFDIVVAGCLVVKNALGLCAVILLLLSVLLPLLRIGLIAIGFKLTAGILEPVTDKKFASALSSTADSMKILVAAIVSASFAAMIFLMTILFVFNLGGL